MKLSYLQRLRMLTDAGAILTVDAPSEPGGGTPPPEPTTPPAPAPKTDDPPPAEDDKLGENGVKALKAERDRATKAEAELTKLRKEIDDAPRDQDA